ncbi:MAG TPA: GNAT family N-acetyltransferase [Flavitalea sp.]|nr:GNAT family N-acetyltransferase [Flavitalea sp.]
MISWIAKPLTDLTPTELYKILRLRAEIFVVEQNCPYLDPDDKDFSSDHLMGWEGDHLAAYARIVLPGISYPEISIGRVATSPLNRGSGLGKELITQCIMFIEEKHGLQPIRIGAQLYLKTFYGSFGFIAQGDIYLEDGIEHIIMLRK